MQTLLIFTSTCKHVRLRQAGSRNLDCLHCASNASRRRCAGIQPCRTTVFSAHQMGTAAMGVDPATSVVDPQGQSWQVAGLYVADGSVLPTPSGEAPALSASCRETYYCFSRPASRVRCFETPYRSAQALAFIAMCATAAWCVAARGLRSAAEARPGARAQASIPWCPSSLCHT